MAAYSARAICNTANDARMDIAVLLGERGRKRHRNLDTTRLDKLERRSERLHKGLSRETALNFVRSSHAHYGLTSQISHDGSWHQRLLRSRSASGGWL